MYINVSKQISDLRGNPLRDASEILTIGGCICTALLAQHDADRGLSGDKKVERWRLAMAIVDKVFPVEVTIEQAALIKKLVADTFGPLVVGQIWDAIENAPSAIAVPAVAAVPEVPESKDAAA